MTANHSAPTGSPGTGPKARLLVASALFLFLELAAIRWFPAQVLFLTFFTNTVLLASFLGLSLGCLAAGWRVNLLRATPWVLLAALAAGAGMESVRLALQDVLNVGENATSPQVVYFGTEVKVQDVARFVVPMEGVAALFFVLIAAVMAGPGQYIGRRFAEIPRSIEAYVWNVAGSLIGIGLFQAMSWRLGPVWWFGAVALGLGWMLWRERPRPWAAAAALAAVPVLLAAAGWSGAGVIRTNYPQEEWSPYYRINYSPESRTIVVNLLGHQNMVSRKEPFPTYALPYLLNRDSGQPVFHDILIIGAGSGNDLSRALQWAAPDARIDAVEIDPVIQRLGARDHPDRPYQDPRVTVHLGDGRNFLRSTARRYDLVVFALIDSLVLHSSVSNIRLESYLFTREAIEDVKRCLKPDGLFAMYNYFRQGWIVSRLTQTIGLVFSRRPVVLTMPFELAVEADQRADGFTAFLAGARAETIRRAFYDRGPYRIRMGAAPVPGSPDGFGPVPDPSLQFAPARIEIPADLAIATDDWPFLYLRNPMVPALSWRAMVLIGVISFGALWAFVRRGGPMTLAGSSPLAMFLLGMGFMLIETKAVVEMALLYGSTWVVNTVVFSAVLVMILVANTVVWRRRPAGLNRYFLLLFAALTLEAVVPLERLLGLPAAVQGVAAALLVFLPVMAAGVIFATLFSTAARPEVALACNTAGAMAGGLAEAASMWVGFAGLLGLALLVYAGAWAAVVRVSAAPRSRAAAHTG